MSEVCLTPVDGPSRRVKIDVLWATGAVTELSVPRLGPIRRVPAAFEARLRELWDAHHTDLEIADILVDEGVVMGRTRGWSGAKVSQFRSRLGMKRTPGETASRRMPHQREDGAWSVRGVAERLGLRPAKVCELAREGHIRSVEGGKDRTAWWLVMDDDDFDRIARHVHEVRTRSRKPTPRRQDGAYSARGVAELLDVCSYVVEWWVKHGWLVPSERGSRGKASWFELTEADIDRLRHEIPRPKTRRRRRLREVPRHTG